MCVYFEVSGFHSRIFSIKRWRFSIKCKFVFYFVCEWNMSKKRKIRIANCSHIAKKSPWLCLEYCQRLVFSCVGFWILSNQLFSSVKMKRATTSEKKTYEEVVETLSHRIHCEIKCKYLHKRLRLDFSAARTSAAQFLCLESREPRKNKWKTATRKIIM